MQIREISVGPNQIQYRQSSESGGAIVLIHGNSGSSRAFHRQLDSRLARHYRLIALDLPGHGQSSPAANPESTYSLRGYAAVLHAAVQELGLQRALFVGWSLGGHILLQAADQLQDASGLLIFGAPPLKLPFNPEECFLPNPGGSLLFREILSKADIRAFAELFFSDGSKDLPESFTEDIRKTDPRARRCLLAALQRSEYRDEAEILQRLHMPIAILHGEHDGLVNLDYVQSICVPTLWRGEPQIIANTGHAPQWEDAESFNRLVEEFIESARVTH